MFVDRCSKDGVLRSYVDGSHCKEHPYLMRHQHVIHILFYFDELEIANALGSKTIIPKLGAFFFPNIESTTGSVISAFNHFLTSTCLC